ncbi:hypothetical protein Q5P01_000280 [Channa striata]|uniref:Immunoglobulin V-set domain-containing protein n=1 Tax=Channa striata TaxID=64152 RepID=A0AA88IHF8_CHASR|nr:hypothetical protein Q5P01_000280 [Channa striata]
MWFVLVLPLTFCINNKGILVKMTEKKLFVTPICSNKTEHNNTNVITLIVCKISTERSRGEECHLRYQHGFDFEPRCDTRFKFRTENQTVFLHLTSLTTEDSGNYSCECSHLDGTNTFHLNITVEEDEDISNSTAKSFSITVAGVTVFLIINGVILGYVCKKNRHGGRRAEPQSSPSNMEPQNNTFVQTENDLYSAHHISVARTQI